jgi:hypothetical protein
MHRFMLPAFIFMVAGLSRAADEPRWIELNQLAAFNKPAADWEIVGDVSLDPENPRRFVPKAGRGVLWNGPKLRVNNLVSSRNDFTDVEVHVEFNIPKGSNSGVKFMGLYEIQILDSFGKKELTGDDCGGIYPRAEEKPRYHHIDKGTAPRVNAAKPAGEWQTFDAVFHAPRFDAEGKKVQNAKLVKALWNGQLIHENVELLYPTGAAWRLAKERPTGPLLLQADHGPVAFRNVKIRPVRSSRE